jgi:hypothetical protein
VVGTKKSNEQSGISKATREWTISMDGLLSSAYRLDGADDQTAELFGFTHDTRRSTIGHAANQLISNAAVGMSNLVVIIQNATYAPVLERYMNDGTIIAVIIVQRWGWINGQVACLEKRTFTTCLIVQFMQVLDYLVLSIRTVRREESMYVHNQSGEQIGSVSSYFSAETGLLGMG